jgi:hypothetical protein
MVSLQELAPAQARVSLTPSFRTLKTNSEIAIEIRGVSENYGQRISLLDATGFADLNPQRAFDEERMALFGQLDWIG